MANRVAFTDLLSDIVDNRGRTCPTAPSGTPLIATNRVRNDLLYPALEKLRYVDDATYDTWFRGHPQPGDIIFVCKGTPGRVCLAPDPVGFCIAQDMVAVRPDPEKVYPKFLFALLRSRDVQAQIENMHVGSLIPHFKKGDFDKLLLDIPDAPVQKQIGDLYFALSSKIDLNRRMNETLEAMARALFKSWFVDFGPVRANAEGRAPSGMDADTAKLFPNELVDSELGPIPKGWTVGSVYELCEVDYGAPYSSKRFVEGGPGRPVIRIRDLASQNPSVRTDEVHARDVAIGPGDIVVGMDGEFRVHVWAGEAAVLNQRLCRVRPKVQRDGTFVRLDIEPPLAFVERTEVATTVIHLGKSDIDQFVVVLPERRVLDAFAHLVGPLEARQLTLAKEGRTLGRLRDELLPRLLSGELPITEAAGLSKMEALAEASG